MHENIHPGMVNSTALAKGKRSVRGALRRHSLLTHLLGGDKNFGKLAEAILRQPLENATQAFWDSIKGYESVLGALISFIPISEDTFQSLMDTCNLSGDYHGFPPGEHLKNLAVIIGNKMRAKRIGKDLSIAEIGGSVSCRIMEALGATCVHADAGYRSSSRPLSMWQKSGDFFMNPDELITLDRYRHRFDCQYDFTVSNRLLDPGSGVEAISEGAGQKSTSAGVKELLAVFSNITKYSGYSIHGGLNAEISSEFFHYIGFDVAVRTGSGRDSLTVFEKREPHPDLWPEGIVIGHKTIYFDYETNCFLARVRASFSPPR